MIKLVSINLNYDFRGWYKAESIYENFLDKVHKVKCLIPLFR